MKIITPGRPKNKIYRAKCHHCGCEFEYDCAETKNMPVALFRDALIVKCPQPFCGGCVAHSENNLTREEEAGPGFEWHDPQGVFLHWLGEAIAEKPSVIHTEGFISGHAALAEKIRRKMAEMGLK